MPSKSELTDRIAAAMVASDDAKSHYEQLRDLNAEGRVSLNEMNEALIAYCLALDNYHTLLHAVRATRATD